MLQGYVSSLRRLLEPARPPPRPAEILVSRASGYAVVIDPDRFDSPRFEALVAQGHSLLGAGQAESAQRALDAGLALWRGPALADFVYEPFAQPEASRLEELRAVCLEDRVECDLDLGRHAGRRGRAGDDGGAAPAARASLGVADGGPLPGRPPG